MTPLRRSRASGPTRVGLLLVAVAATACTSTARPAAPPSTPSGGGASPAPTTSATTSPSRAPAPGTAAAALAGLAVKGRAPRTGYDREQFGPAWTDDNDAADGRNGCDTRNDVLARDLSGDVLKPGTRDCVVLAGTLRDPYTGRVIAFRRGVTTSAAVQIDHVVALSNAWQTGAQQLTPRERRTLANDPLELLAVDGPVNQAKGDGDAATWLPPNRAYRCAYVARQIAVKRSYRLWVTPAERDAMRRVLASCPAQPLPTG